ncbi:hypothetical protein BN871_HM_00290 [Paenibacillus sp. P22]|nr:hypothetical protein BN871_HM_00290 [Paenibacillus sp. P22]
MGYNAWAAVQARISLLTIRSRKAFLARAEGGLLVLYAGRLGKHVEERKTFTNQCLKAGRSMLVERNGWPWRSRKTAVLVLGLAGAGLIAFGLRQPRDPEPAGWVQVNAALAEAMAGKEAAAGGDGGNGGTGIEDGGAVYGQAVSGGEAAAGNGTAAGGASGGAEATEAHQGGEAGKGSADGGSDSGAEAESKRKPEGDASSDAGERSGTGAKGGAIGSGEGAESGRAAGGNAASDGRLDLNRASAEQLDALPGVGPAKAGAIVEERERSGFFRSVEDVQRVKGIGPKIVEKWKDLVVVLP